MFVLDSVACADTFPADGSSGGAQIIASNGSNGGYAAVTGADVMVQLAYAVGGPGQGLIEWTTPVHVGQGNIILEKGTRGIRFRNYAAGVVATVSAGLSEPIEPALQLTSAGVSSAAPSTSSGLVLIQTQTLAAPAAVITFSGIVATYKHLFLEYVLRSDTAAKSSAIWMRLNNVSAANSYLSAAGFDTKAVLGLMPAATQTDASSWSRGAVDIPFYNDNSEHTIAGHYAGRVNDGGGVGDFGGVAVGAVCLVAPNNGPVTRVDLSAAAGNLIAGSQASLYGISG